MSAPVRVRFAPSPTGYLHVGGARTALFNWLQARHTGGTFVLRVEDTDQARNSAEAVQVIFDGLRWLGLDWDEGPFFQSEREEIYTRHAERLLASGHAYHDDAGALRFRQPRQPVAFDDLVCGHIAVDRAQAQNRAGEPEADLTLRRADGGWIFHFVNVVDDLEMKITHVIRGEDHLSNTPKHLELYAALGAEPPRFAHIPLILNPDGSKMSKRDQGASVAGYMAGGYVPEAVRNYLCLLGWSPKDDREKLPIEEVVRLFDLEKINRKNAAFDLGKLAWLNGEYVRELEPERFHALAIETLQRAGTPLEGHSPDYISAAIATCRGKVRLLTELPAYAGFYFADELSYDAEAAAKHFTPENAPRLSALRAAFATTEPFDAATLEVTLKNLAAQLGVKPAVLVHPARLAATGATAGPSLYHLLEVLGRERVLARIDRGLARPEFAA